MSNPIFTNIIKPTENLKLNQEFSKQLSSPIFVADLLLNNKIDSTQKARTFFLAENPPFTSNRNLLNLPETVETLKQIYTNQDRILIHGDYDVDGITGTAILYRFLKKTGFCVQTFIPNRFQDGYGITLNNINKFAKQGIKWIITVDTGITANKEIELANQLGMQVIVTDHHQSGNTLPLAKLIVNPNQSLCSYPNSSLCGAAVAWKIVNAYAQKYLDQNADNLLYLVALASLSDVVEINAENKYLIRKGLKVMLKSPDLGLQELLRHTKLNQKESLTSTDVLFGISPLLNAAGRVDDASLSLQLLITENRQEAKENFQKLLTLNLERRSLEKIASEEALQKINLEDNLIKSCIILHSPNWHEGIIGIVASRVLEKTQKPTIIMNCKDGICKGSGRSVLGFNLHKALQNCQDIFINWGGHYYACGFSILEENIPKLKEHLNMVAQKHLPDNFFVPRLQPHTAIEFRSINKDTMLWLQRFEPCGPSNERPLFYSEKVHFKNTQIIGKQHLKFDVSQNSHTFSAIYFNSIHFFQTIKEFEHFNIVFYLEWNYFRNSKTIQFQIKGIHNY